MLHVTFVGWMVTVVAVLVLLAADQRITRGRHLSTRTSVCWVSVYAALALAFAGAIAVAGGRRPALEFLAGYVTELSLSVDNLFVFVIIISSFAVPRSAQRAVLSVGIALALVMRGIFIALGTAAVQRFVWVFFVFSVALVATAVKLARGNAPQHDGPRDSRVVQLVARLVPTSPDFDGDRVVTRVADRRVVTPLLLVMVAIGSTDVLFALDSIPAIFGLTQDPYLVFTANAFALMGLRQLYFLLEGLLDRLVHLSYGLAAVLAFIGVKLVLHALHEYGVDWAPEIGILPSLAAIVGTLVVVTVTSLSATSSGRRSAPSSGAELSDGGAQLGGEDVELRGRRC